MKTTAIIQAHMGSTRLPGKVLLKIGNRSMLARVVRRALRARTLSAVIVACSTEAADEAIVRECERIGISYFRGSDSDVLDRYYQASRAFPSDAYVRVTSDCPVIDPEVIDHVVTRFEQGEFDYASNTVRRTYPRGLDTEVFTSEGLARTWREAKEPYQRVHVTPYFYQNPQLFKLGFVTQDVDQNEMRWTVDTPDDLRFITAVYDRLGGHDEFSWRDVLTLLERQPELAAINQHVQQKKLQEL
jgi:spore coat polysaccharide biosynthesis protein SpsF